MHCIGKPMTGHVVIEKAKYFCDAMKITEECTFSEGSNKNQPCKDLEYRYCLKIWNLSSPVGAVFKEFYCKMNDNQLH